MRQPSALRRTGPVRSLSTCTLRLGHQGAVLPACSPAALAIRSPGLPAANDDPYGAARCCSQRSVRGFLFQRYGGGPVIGFSSHELPPCPSPNPMLPSTPIAESLAPALGPLFAIFDVIFGLQTTLFHIREYGYGSQRRSSTLCTTHHPQNCRLLSPFTIPQHNSSSISARLYAYSDVHTRAWKALDASLLAERLKPLFPKKSGADRPGLLVMACCPHRAPARANVQSSTLPASPARPPCHTKRDKTLGAGHRNPTKAYVLQVAAAFTVSMSSRTNDEAALSCKSLGRRAPTRATCMTCHRDSPHAAFSKVPERFGLIARSSRLTRSLEIQLL
ncbi:hypothetical protein BKA58DRAFT_419072 [Alternaria rosae]|uniref:uncharacterized protein n=1 Tax=Alternaria rosae TaxID=1187941 RepID=UPI001E8D0777|nr:uncharacterized protein BKA58DRAFT_419072 [Alternaria rosae]KAH6875562.1 hypothetical protein BKA58DRAFT_419072 [Alternaria rosae]